MAEMNLEEAVLRCCAAVSRLATVNAMLDVRHCEELLF